MDPAMVSRPARAGVFAASLRETLSAKIEAEALAFDPR